MKLTKTAAMDRLTAHDHGVLCTLHPDRGVDPVPVVYAEADGFIGVPIDRVKPKSSLKLQREQNLEADPRASLLIEHWNRDDWSQLWWVRAQLRYERAASDQQATALAAQLGEAFDQYHDEPFTAMLILRIAGISGWTASDAHGHNA